MFVVRGLWIPLGPRCLWEGRGEWEGHVVPALLWICCKSLAFSGPLFLHAQLEGLQEISMEVPLSPAPAI